MSNVVALAIPAKSDVPEELRKLADEIEAGEYEDVRVGLVILDTPDTLHRRTIGPNLTTYETVGILEAAKTGALAQLFGD